MPCLDFLAEATQIGPHLRRARITLCRILLQSFSYDALKLGRNCLIKSWRPLGYSVNERVKIRCRGLSLEWQDPCCHLVQHDAKRKQVRTGVQRLAQCLLRRHVRHSSKSGARTMEVFRGLRDSPEGVTTDTGFVPHGELCQAEVQNLRMTAFGDKNICRLNIAVNDAVRVGGVERVGDLNT